MRNFLFILRFDGGAYHGWQIQKDARTVQEVFQTALGKLLPGNLEIKGCSRTDAGVHANMYCASVKSESQIPCERLKMAVNSYLPGDLAVFECQEVPENFHARYSCTGKEYVYKIWNSPVREPFLRGRALHYWHPLDVERLHFAAQNFVGQHNFSAFCTKDQRGEMNMTRTVNYFEVEREGNLVTMRVLANGYLYNMVRIMVGTLLEVASGRRCPEDILSVLKSRDRALAGPTAVPHGLYLNRVFYHKLEMGVIC